MKILFLSQVAVNKNIDQPTGDGGGGEYVTLVTVTEFVREEPVECFFSFSLCSASLWLNAKASWNSSSSRSSSSDFRGGTYKYL